MQPELAPVKPIPSRPFLCATAQEQPNLIQWLAGYSSLPGLCPFSAVYRQKKKCDLCFWKISTYKLSGRCLHLLCVSLSQREDIKADVTIFVVFASILPYASDEANQSGSERPTYHSVDIFWNGFGKQRKRSSGRAGKTARKSLYEIRLFLGCDIGKGRGGIGFTGANSGCTERKNYQNFSANCNNTHPFSMSQS